MNLSGIISISGKPGLSKIVSQTRTGLIVESLMDGKRSPVHGAERVSSLEDISIYTYEEDVLLSEVFEKMHEKAGGKAVLSHKSSASELSTYLKEVLPKYDEERVYASDIKKLIQWYNLLHEKALLIPSKDEKGSNKDEKSTKTASSTDKKKTKTPVAKEKTPKKVKAPTMKAAPKAAAKGR